MFVPDVLSCCVCANFADFCDPHLKKLAFRLESADVIASRTTGTTYSCRGALARGENFALSRDDIQAFPAKTENVALYLQHLLDTTHSRCAVDCTIYDIQWAHNVARIFSPTDQDNFFIHAVSSAAKNRTSCGQQQQLQQKQPVSADLTRNFEALN